MQKFWVRLLLMLLLAPLATFFFLATYERWLYDQADLYVDGRTFLVMIAPPGLAVIAQWLVLRAGRKLPRLRESGSAETDPAKA